MSELHITKQIEETLLKIVSHKNNPAIIFIDIDTSIENGEIVPFLNIYGSLVFDEVSCDDALIQAVDNSDSSYIEGVLEEIDSSSFEINLSVFYPDWPEELETGDKKVISIINSLLNKNKEKFNLVEKLYFHYVDNLDFVKIIDKPTSLH